MGKKNKPKWYERHPELLKQWHPKKNGLITPFNCRTSDVVRWYYPYDDPYTGKHFDFEWQAKVKDRNKSSGCPFLSGRAVWPGFNDLATKRSDLAAQWHPTKNGDKTPKSVTCGSHDVVWWYYPYDDPDTGLHFNFEWEAAVYSRVEGKGCPFISGKAVWPGYNDLATKRCDLAAQWHPTKNGEKMPKDVTCGSGDMVWWYYPYDDPDTGLHFDFEWEAQINNRVNASGCPFLNNRAVWPGFNDLATKRRDLAAQWHPTKNGNRTPKDVTCGCGDLIWWLLSYDDARTGKHFNFEWQATVNCRIKDDSDCPYLSGHAVWEGFNDLKSCYPDIARDFHPQKNRKDRPDQIYKHEGKTKRWWQCIDCGHEWRATVLSRTVDGSCCPKCRRKISKG